MFEAGLYDRLYDRFQHGIVQNKIEKPSNETGRTYKKWLAYYVSTPLTLSDLDLNITLEYTASARCPDLFYIYACEK